VKITKKQLRNLIIESVLSEDTFPGRPTELGELSDKVTEVADILTKIMRVAKDNPQLTSNFSTAMVSAAMECGSMALFGGASPEEVQECVEGKAGDWLSENWGSLLGVLVDNPDLMKDVLRLQEIAAEVNITLEMPS
tara:strand:+ start:101 stop:511 length:411 start_codon:yes stop_codon:yes gene_type:complete